MTSKTGKSVEALKQEIKELKGRFAYGVARKRLESIIETCPDELWFKQQLALCTYKDEELPAGRRFKTAIGILESIGLRSEETKDAETLALGGAVYKRWWEYGGQLERLYEALNFYRSAWEKDPGGDMGYGGINAAYILQLLAARARSVACRNQIPPVEAQAFEAQAEALRRAVAHKLPQALEEKPGLGDEYWFCVTMAEAHFGLKEYAAFEKWVERFSGEELPEWELQTTFRQLVSIARLQGIELPEAGTPREQWDRPWQSLFTIMGEDTRNAMGCYRGKVGLALSGGGFRASLYHLGVLARLAEMDALRSVEVLSTVSGGSIVGAHYYLEVKHLLETREDSEITRGHYIRIVEKLQRDFLSGIQENVRVRAFSDFMKNLRMIVSKEYSRSHRLGELYEELFYGKVGDGHPEGMPRYMHELIIRPKGEKEFKPGFSNWRRRAKVPVLLLNTTSLNTGHNWRFTASSMGEPPGVMGDDVDKNSRYRRLWYSQAPTEELKNFRLGHAVAASACVPGLFEPLAMEGLYEDRVVRLVDGGVHDNQGAQGLLDEGCTMVLVSDASGQMDDKEKPSDSIPSVVLRANSILMDRVREAEYQDLKGRLDSRALQGLLFVHLKKDLGVHPLDWVGCQDPLPTPAPGTLPYGVDPEIQKSIAAIRTDLDSFSDVEAAALMCSGYLMAEQQTRALQETHGKNKEPGMWGDFQVDASRKEWSFLRLAPLMEPSRNPTAPRRDLKKQLEAGSHKTFKIWRLDDTLKRFSWALIVMAILPAAVFIWRNWGNPLLPCSITVGGTVKTLIIMGLAAIFPVAKWYSAKKAIRGMAKNVLIALVGSFAMKIHLRLFDKLFLERGRIDRLIR